MSDHIEMLRELCGFIENGTDTTVQIHQDDATRSWSIRVGKQRPVYGATLTGAIENAYETLNSST